MHVGRRAMGQVVRASGQFGEEQPVREGATTQARFIAFIGRDSYWQRPGTSYAVEGAPWSACTVPAAPGRHGIPAGVRIRA